MVFSTAIFLFLFLPLFLGIYYLIPARARSAWILCGSWIFYGWWRLDFLFLLILTCVWNYFLGKLIHKSQHKAPPATGAGATAALAVGLILNIGSLAYFKYFNFAVDSLNAVLTAAGAESLQTWSVILPIGISFYIFQASSYLVDVYRSDAPAARSFIDLSAYIALFPQLIAGPILRYKDLADQFVQRRHGFDLFSRGSYRFMYGFAKKVLIADTVAVIADTAFALESPGFAAAWLGSLAYTAQLYFDFSAYSDMAIGLGLMMGFRFMENFNHPYISRSIAEFWRRWHISLSTWLRDYLYIPLGGNRRGRIKTYRNMLLVMLLGGLWHGAAWNFVLWGLWHGLLLMIERLRSDNALGDKKPRSTPGTIAVFRTFFLVVIGWVVFRAADLAGAGRMYAGMLGMQGVGQFESLLAEIGLLAPLVLFVSFILMFRTLIWKGSFLNRQADISATPATAFSYGRLFMIPFFLLGIIKLLAESHSPFLYFQF
ncbi:MBOAT family O-acyltransferase [Spirochaeta dissipatitropha]